VLRRLCITLTLTACQPLGSGDEGLVIVSDTAQVGPPPACNAETPTTGEAATDSGAASTGQDTSGEPAIEGAAELSLRPGDVAIGRAEDLSFGPGRSAAPDPGTGFCAQFTSAATCDGTQRKDGETVIGECRWQQVVPVVPGTCEATQLYNTCVHIPVDGGPCEAPGSCGQIGLGVYGRTGCDGTIEILVVPPGKAFCTSPTDWPLCWPKPDGDIAPECTCICS
jgi:hypothetical protein